MRFATFNIRYGVREDGVYDLDRAAALLAEVDVAAVQEVTQHWKGCNFDDQAELLASKLNLYYTFASAYDVDASVVDGSGRIRNRRRTFGNMVLSRWPIISARSIPLPKSPAADRYDQLRCAVEAVVDAPSGPLRVYSCHLSHISTERRIEQIRFLRDIIDRGPSEGSAWDFSRDEFWTEGRRTPTLPSAYILMGDFNIVTDGAEYAAVLSPSDHHGSIVHDVWDLSSEQHGMGFTYPSAKPEKRIDFAFASPELKTSIGTVWTGANNGSSDHLPYYFEVSNTYQ